MKTVTIKSANGSVEDFKVDAEPSWTVKELKGYIYRLYPTHPPLTCQKLIHGGKLLLDQSTLAEVIPTLTSDREDAVVIHLVAYERSKSAPSASFTSALGTNSTERTGSSASIRSNTSGDSSVRSRAGPNRQPSQTPSQDAGHGAERGGGANIAEQPSQQRVPPVMNPWLRHRGPMLPNPMPGAHNLPGGFGAGGAMGMGAGYPFPPPLYQAQYAAVYANQVQQWYYNYYRAPVGAQDAEMRRDEPHPQDLPVNDPNDQPEPEEPEDIPMAAGGMGMMAGGGGGMRQRDLLDYLYKLSMLLFLMLIAYMTGSFGRLLIFAAGIILVFLNQAGFFSIQRRRQPVSPPRPQLPPRPQDQVDNAELVNQGGGVQEQGNQGGGAQEQGNQEGGVQEQGNQEGGVQEQGNQEGGVHEEGNQGGIQEEGRPDGDQAAEGVSLPPSPPPAEQGPGVVATLFIFVTSFFTSLVPQQRPELQVN